MKNQIKKAVKDLITYTDNYPWYWYSYGEKCYAYAVVAAIAQNEDEEPDALKEAGDELNLVSGKLFTQTGIEMCVMDHIANIESQQGYEFCKFLALAHTFLIEEYK